MNEDNPYQAPQPTEFSSRPVNGWDLSAFLSWPFYFVTRLAAIGMGFVSLGSFAGLFARRNLAPILIMGLVSALLCRWCWKTANRVKRQELQ